LNGIGGVRNPTYYSLNFKVVYREDLSIPRVEKYMRKVGVSKDEN